MASSSSTRSLQLTQRKYDVFLSFRGEDTRRNFTSHLFEVLRDRGIFTFLDDKSLEHGDSIPKELVKAIKDSQVAVIIFSKNYATSRWCLNEVVKILECKDKNEQTVIPVFYNVDPSHVRSQRESFAEAFAKHESNYKDDVEGMQKVHGWRTALSEVANLKGYDIRDKIESECIRDLVDRISSKLCKTSLSYLQNVVGIDTHLEEVNSLLAIETDDVRIVGIWGMGGAGKTTIARAIFDTLSYQFEAASFLADIKENEKKNQLHSLQNTLLSELLRRKVDYVNNKYDGKCMISSRLCSKKVLIVLDDIDERDHLEYLADDVSWFGNGSRVVVTTRNRDLLENADAIYEVKLLPDHEATQLFYRYAFRKEVPSECFKKLSLEVVNHAKGLPLALKVWGSSLHKKDLTRWGRTVEQIKKNSGSEIVEKLKISYDGLEPEEQKIFLDMACFFRGDEKEKVIQILESCDFGAEYGLDVLIDKSLVFLTEFDAIEMHDLIQDMGKYIVNMPKDPGERSRLWDAKDIKEVIVDNTGTKVVEAIWLDYQVHLCFSKESMKKMKMLRMLYMGFSMWSSDSYRDGSIEYLSNNLRWFHWCRYPWESLPTKFEPKKLVHLELRRSELRQLWKETKMYFPRLRTLDLCGSENLMETPDFREMPNLEYLNLQGCRSLEEVDDSLGYCEKLIELDLGCCLRLKRFPCVNVESLEYLDLYRCFSLEIFPEIRGRSKSELEIYMGYSGIRELPSFIQYLTHITELDLSGMKNLVALPSSIGMLISLVELNVSNCSELESFPEEIGDLENLEKLDAENTLISRPPSSIVRLNKLKFLSFEKAIFGDETDEEIIGEEIGGFAFPQVNEGLRSLETLNLRYCNLIDEGLPEDIGCLSSLEELNLWGNNFEYLPRSIAQFGALRFLDVSYCERLKESPGFMGMPNLETLDLSNCMNLEEVHHSLRFLKKLWRLNLCNCKRLKRFPALCIDSLVFLDLKRCSSLEKFPEILGSMNLQLESGTRCLDLGGLENLVTLPSSIGMWKILVGLYLWDCSNLEILSEEIGDLENLEKLDASNTLIGQPPPSLVRLNKLKFLIFDKRKSKVGLKDGVCFVFPQVNDGLHSLKDLDLSYCNLIDGGLPEDIGSLSSLEELNLGGNNFEQLPQSIAQLSALQSLDLSDCKRLKELPEFPQQLDTIYTHWSNDWICNSLFQNISSLQHDISASDSLSPRVFTTRSNIPSWFHHRGTGRSVSVNLPENWYVPDNFLGFAVCYSGRLIETTTQLFPLCDDGVSSMTQKLTLSNHSECVEPKIHFFLVSFAGKWGMSKANGKTPNDYGCIMLFFGELKDFGLRLLYKDEPELDVLLQMSENSDEPELEALLQMRENNDEPTKHGIMTRTSRYENSEHHDSVNNEASCSSQIVTFLIFVGTLFLRICSNE